VSAPEEAARPATAADRDPIVALAGRALAELAPTRGGEVWRRREARPEPLGASIDAALAEAERPRGATFVVVGTLDDVIVGYGVVSEEALRDGARLGVVEDIYVEPDARGVGVGEAVMDALLAWCEARGCVGVDALALPGNRATKNFFERFGLTARAIVVHRRLAAGGAADP